MFWLEIQISEWFSQSFHEFTDDIGSLLGLS